MSHLACQVCGAACDESWPCVGCQALYYCSSKHRRLGIRLGHDAEECSRMKQQLGRAEEVVNFDIPWDVKTSDEVYSWLKQLHCHDSGLLQYSIRCQQQQQQQQQGSSPDSECTPQQQQQQQDDASPPENSSKRLQQQQQQQGSDSYPCLPQTAHDWYQGWAPLSDDLVPSWPADSSSSSSNGTAAVQNVDQAVDRTNQSSSKQTQQQQQQRHRDQQQQQPKGPQGMVTIQSWDDYYTYRNIPKNSPAALCVHFPLTVWYCLTHILPERGYKLPTVTFSSPAEKDDSSTAAAAAAAATVNIIYLGPQCELEMLAVFSELLLLLPGYHINIHMIGPDVPQQMHGRATRINSRTTAAAAAGSVTISCWNGCWHDVQQEWMQYNTAAAAAARDADVSNAPLSSPSSSSSWFPASPLSADDQIHLVFAANAGLAAFLSWIQTLLQLATMHSSSSDSSMCIGACIGANASQIQQQQQQQQQQQEVTAAVNHIPVLFTDYCEEAAVKSMQMAECVTNQGFNITPLLNPFRQPVLLQHHHGTKLPACSNCFIFGWV